MRLPGESHHHHRSFDSRRNSQFSIELRSARQALISGEENVARATAIEEEVKEVKIDVIGTCTFIVV